MGPDPTPESGKPWPSRPTLRPARAPGTLPPTPWRPTTVCQAPCHHLEPSRWAWASVAPSVHSPAWSSPGEGSIPSTSRTPSRSCPDTPASCHPPGSPPSQGRAYLSDTAGVVLGLGGGPEQAGGHGRRPQLQGPTEVRGVGGGSSGGGGRRRAGLLALGGQAELLGSPGEGRGGEGRGGRRGEGRGREERRVRVLRAVLPPAPP